MAEKMAVANATQQGNRKDGSTRKKNKPAKTCALKEKPVPDANLSEDMAEVERAIHEQVLNAKRDPGKAVKALRQVIKICIASDLKGIVTGMIQTAKNGNTIAMKLLIDLCNVVDPDGAGDGPVMGYSFTEVLDSEFPLKSLPEFEYPTIAETAETGTHDGPGVDIAGIEPE
jgi:hypothetical protein